AVGLFRIPNSVSPCHRKFGWQSANDYLESIHRMVCCPCFVIPFLLWLFHKFIGPWISKIWGKPAEMVQNVEDNLVCPWSKKNEVNSQDNCKTSPSKADPSSASKCPVSEQTNLNKRIKTK
ncbi:hypothetical protein EGW08_009344, partial [Elysia chlorotica]